MGRNRVSNRALGSKEVLSDSNTRETSAILGSSEIEIHYSSHWSCGVREMISNAGGEDFEMSVWVGVGNG